MDKFYQDLIDAVDNLAISMAKQRALGLDPEVLNAWKELTKARNRYKKVLNLKLLTQQKLQGKKQEVC